MWNLFNCYMSGRHDYGMWCEPGEIFLRCVHCGARSSGWALQAKLRKMAPHATGATASTAPAARVIPFDRAAES